MTDGLYLEPDSSPFTSGAMTTGESDIVDGVDCTGARSAYWSGQYSYGIDFGESKEVFGLDVYCIHAGGDLSTWYSSAMDSAKVFKSSDNSAWTEVDSGWDGPPIFYHISNCLGFRLEFSSSQTARYFKVVNVEASNTFAFGAGGASGKVAEIEEYVSSSLTVQDTYHEHSADNVVLVGPPTLTVNNCYHEHFADNIALFAGALIVQDTYHEHFADNVILETTTLLVVNDTYHEHFADNITLSMPTTLTVHDCYHSHYSTPGYALKLIVTSVIIDADVTIPFIQIETSFGMEVDITIPMIQVDADIVPRDEITVDLVIPMIQVAAEIIHSISIDADITIPMIQVDGIIKSGNYLTVDITIPFIEIESLIGFNNIIQGSLTIPMIEIDAQIKNVFPTIILKHSRC